jgi:Ser/Thr protein kinase RdoA (MazF antagonist)
MSERSGRVKREPEVAAGLDTLALGAVAAAIAVGRELGLEVSGPRVLANDQNLLLQLTPDPVVARVATRIAWSRPDPAAWLAREVAVASHAARNGGPVVPPTDLVEPGPHTRNGYALTLWTYVDTDEKLASEAEVGEALGQLHLSLIDFPRSALPDRLPVHAQIENGLAALTRDQIVDAGILKRLSAMHRQLSLELDLVNGTEGVIHGDAHPWNLLHTNAGWRWIDMEETGFGAQEFDLAVLASKVDDPTAALASYASTMGSAVAPAGMLAPFHRIRELETVVWGLGMAVTDASFRDTAEDRLRRLLEP